MNPVKTCLGAVLLGALAFGATACDDDDPTALPSPEVDLPAGFRMELVVNNLDFPTALTWDDQGRMYVAETGGGLTESQLTPLRILRVEPGRATEVVNLSDKGVNTALSGMVWSNGAFFITHTADDGTGAVSRVTPDGQVTQLFKGIIDAQVEHQVNDIQVGPDGRMYIAVGLAGNAAVMGPDVAGRLKDTPMGHATACRDIVLTGRNFKSEDFRTETPGDSVLTGAFVPFGVATTPGQVIPGVAKCGGSILAFEPGNAEATIRMYAWGFRNVIGIAFDRGTGEMFATQNGYDVRGTRPVRDYGDPSFRIREGAWYGTPDFSAAREPLTDPKFESPDELQAMVFRGTQPIGKDLGFVIDHAASGLAPPDPSLLVAMHEWNASPSQLDVAPASWGEFAGQLFIAEYGDLKPNTNPLTTFPTGRRVVRVDPTARQVMPFIGNSSPRPAPGRGLNRPFNVKFGPDGAMYIVDWGVVEVNPGRMPPYEEKPGTGAIWKVTRTSR